MEPPPPSAGRAGRLRWTGAMKMERDLSVGVGAGGADRCDPPCCPALVPTARSGARRARLEPGRGKPRLYECGDIACRFFTSERAAFHLFAPRRWRKSAAASRVEEPREPR